MLKCIFFVVMSLIAITKNLHAKETLTYHKLSGSKDITTTYTYTSNKDSIAIESSNNEQKTEAISSPDYILKSFNCQYMKNKDHSLFTLKDGKLTAEGIIKGEKLKEVYNIKNSLWIQEFEFGLKPFLISSKKSCLFDILHPKNFKLHKMIAKKHGTESIIINNTTHKAQVVHITLQGFKSMFWKAELWYDKTTHDLLLYKSNEGPNTPNVTITLISKKGAI